MQTCETCQHWVESDPPEYVSDVHPSASALRRCGMPREEFGEERPRAAVVAYGSEVEGAFLLTRADFGCIAHEPRD
ncbi:hypothetical protein F8B43_0031 [Methylorubrum populi]|uniref:Uncharacterized protein n=1 Tax=Methylorubrum populi TaxID=223967 RepID=A0A833JCN7_9HYPH|nr:hypothetical protein F8B43_0031 [Methylorubrum populi]